MAINLAKTLGTKKGHLSRAINSLNDCLETEAINIVQIKKYLDSVIEKYKDLKPISDKLVELYRDEENDEAAETELNKMDEIESKVMQIKSIAENTLEEIKRNKDEIKTKRNEDKKEKDSVNLPKLQLEKFSGEIGEYREFLDMYTVTIHNNQSLSAVEKFQYLKTYLIGQAKQLIDGLTITDGNYKYALEILEETYGNKEVLINNHVSKLISLTKYDENDNSSLRNLYNKINKHVRELESLGITADMYSVFLVPIVLSKLNEHLIHEWTKTKMKGIQNLIKFLKRELEGMETSNQMMSGFCTEHCENKDFNKPFEPNKVWQKENYKNFHTASALNVQTRRASCIFCPEMSDHYADECKTAEKMPYNYIKAILTQSNACFGCMKRGHCFADCNRKQWVKCKKCNATSHPTLLHLENDEINTSSYLLSTTKSTEPQPNGVKETSPILPLAVARLIGSNGNYTEVNVLLDTGSDTNFITEAVAEKIGLIGDSIKMSINGIIGKTDESKQHRVVEASLGNRNNFGEFKLIEFVEVPKICTTYRRPAIDETIIRSKNLRDLELADDYSKEKCTDIDILIGIPSYWSIVTGRVKRSKDGPIAVQTLLGWVLMSSGSNKSSNRWSMLTSTKKSEVKNENPKLEQQMKPISPNKDNNSEASLKNCKTENCITKIKKTVKMVCKINTANVKHGSRLNIKKFRPVNRKRVSVVEKGVGIILNLINFLIMLYSYFSDFNGGRKRLNTALAQLGRMYKMLLKFINFQLGRVATNMPIKSCKRKKSGNLLRKEKQQCLVVKNNKKFTVHIKVKYYNILKAGKLLIVAVQRVTRFKWKVGLIEKVKKGRDGKIRQCEVRTAKRGTLTRPVQHVARLEMDTMEEYKKFSLTSLNGGECQILRE